MVKAGIDNGLVWERLLKNKKIGLITNPTGVSYRLEATVDILARKGKLIKLFAPEHGIRGNVQAGETVAEDFDVKTHVPIYSLYGKTKKPTMAMLEDLEMLVYDIQDVGVRYYTYLYTMAYAMEAAKEKGIPFVVMDRPNPLSGMQSEGTLLKTDFRSFVGYYPIIQRYGLTVGEVAKLFNEQFAIDCDLHIVPMVGWQRTMYMEDTQLPFVMPSPNIPTIDTACVYLATCLFEGTNVSEGRGTTKPFHLIGAPWFQADQVLKALAEYPLKGVRFKESYFTPTFSKHKDVLCRGIELFITDRSVFEGVACGFVLFDCVRKIHPELMIHPPYKAGMHPMLDLLVGDDFLSKERLSLWQILDKIHEDTIVFNQMKERFHLYD